MPTEKPTNLYESIREHLDSLSIHYRVFKHAPTRTSEQSAVARGSELRIGAKALFVKHDGGFVGFVVPADRQLDWKLVKLNGFRGARFATADELADSTGLEKGAVPPLLNLLGIDVVIDPAVIAQERIQFNAGSLSCSLEIDGADLLRATGGWACAIAKMPTATAISSPPG